MLFKNYTIFNNPIQDPKSIDELASLPRPTNPLIIHVEEHNTHHITISEDNNNKNPTNTHVIEENDEFIWLKLADKGTFGTVYKVKDAKTDQIYAIKRVYQDPSYINTEYHILKLLNHVNCIKTYRGYYTKDKHSEKVFLNIIMEYVPTTLYHIIKFYNKHDLQFPTLIGKVYAYQLFRALMYIENKSIVHRDLKPKNILIETKNHQLILADFGSAKIMQDDTISISYICTRYYRAPELLLGDETYRYKVDIWAAGCIIAEIFLCHPLFMGKSTSDQLLQIIKVLGTPSKDYIDVLLKKKDINLPPCRGLGLLRKLEGVEPLIIDLIAKTLIYDPDMRISPLEALLHPCFNELRSAKLQINDKDIADLFNFTLDELNGDYEILSKLVPR